LQEITFDNDAYVKSSCHQLFTLSNTVTNKQCPTVTQRSKGLVGILYALTRIILQHPNIRHEKQNRICMPSFTLSIVHYRVAELTYA